MKTPVLIVSPQNEFSELVSQALNETGLYEGQQAKDQETSIEYLRSSPNCRFVLLDTNLGDQAVIEIANSIRNLTEEIHTVLVSADHDLTRFDDILPWKTLHKPFALSDLLDVIGGNWPTVINVNSVAGSSDSGFPWMLSSQHAKKILIELTSRMNIREAIITRDHSVWASTGVMATSTISEINHLINRHNKFKDKYDLFRYIWIDGVRKEYKLYAVSLLLNTVLALIFDLVTPTHNIREDANLIAEQLLLPLLPGSIRHSPSWDHKNNILISKQQYLPTRINNSIVNNIVDRDSIKIDDRKILPQFGNYTLPEDIYQPEIIVPPSDQIIHDRGLNASWDRQSKQSPVIYLDTDLIGADLVTFSGLLTPRFADQSLSGNITQILYNKVPQICISYGWRLWSMEISKDCLQWIVDVPPDLSPLKHVRILKKQTSECIADENQTYMNKNLSHEFWASGFSIIGGKHHYTATELESFVHKIRLAYQILQ